jgi:rhodanese-related sulfurtransferase
MQQFFTFAFEHWFLFGLLAIFVLALLWVDTQGKVGGMKRLTTAQTINILNKEHVIVIDIRARDAFNKGHIANALHIPHDDIMHKELTAYQNTPVIIVCTAGVSAQKLGKELKSKGLNFVYFLQGGMNAWYAENLPVVKK